MGGGGRGAAVEVGVGGGGRAGGKGSMGKVSFNSEAMNDDEHKTLATWAPMPSLRLILVTYFRLVFIRC